MVTIEQFINSTQVDSPSGGPNNANIITEPAYVTIGILGALIWDVFTNLGEDYELVQKFPIKPPTIVYFLSRIATLLCISFTAKFYSYFLTTALVSTFALGLFFFAPKAIAQTSGLLALINVGAMALMACKIYRKTRLGANLTEPETSLRPMEFTVNFPPSPNVHGNRSGGVMV